MGGDDPALVSNQGMTDGSDVEGDAKPDHMKGNQTHRRGSESGGGSHMQMWTVTRGLLVSVSHGEV